MKIKATVFFFIGVLWTLQGQSTPELSKVQTRSPKETSPAVSQVKRLLLATQAKKELEHSVQKTIVKPVSKKNNVIKFQFGGGDAGGGNTFNGQPLEHFGKSTSEMDGYREFVEPILQKLDQDIPDFSKVLRTRADALRWYVLPASFETLSSALTEIPIDSDQTAIQFHNDIFVSEHDWKKAKEDNGQGKLLIHEIVESQYFQIRKNEKYIYREFRNSITMSNVRNISARLSTYDSSAMRQLQNELVSNNFGFYVSRDLIERWNAEVYPTLKTMKDFNCSSEISREQQSASLSALTSYLVVFKMQIASCYYFSDACYLSSKESEALNVKFFAGLNLWAHLAQLFPKQLVDNLSEKTVSNENDPIRYFDQIFPGQRGSEADLQMGQEVCRKLNALDIEKLRYQAGYHPRQVK